MDCNLTKTSSLVDLPSHILRRIYYFTDLVHICPCDLVLDHETRPSHDASFRFSWGNKGSWEEPSCTYIARGTGLYAYRNDTKPVCFEPFSISLLLVSRKIYGGALSVLYGRNKFRLKATASNMLKLLVQIGHNALSHMRSLHIILEDSDWDDTLRETSLSQWKRTCGILAHAIKPGSLSFAFTCISLPDNEATRNDITESLVLLPPLKSCAISLGLSCDGDLNTLAKDTTLALMGGKPESVVSSAHPSLIDLPREVRALILENTDLVPEWDATELKITDGKLETYAICCGRCNDTLEPCSCKEQSGTYSSSCECRTRFNTALFRVNRQLYHEALEILYPNNRFRFSGDLTVTHNVLRQFPIQALPLLRKLDIQFDITHVTQWNHPLSLFPKQWQTLLQFLALNLDLPNLWLSIIIGKCDDEYMLDDESGLPSSIVIASHNAILKAVQQLKGLGKLFVFFHELCHMEEAAEKEVMGEGYDSGKEGKLPPHARSFTSPHMQWRESEFDEGPNPRDRDDEEDGLDEW